MERELRDQVPARSESPVEAAERAEHHTTGGATTRWDPQRAGDERAHVPRERARRAPRRDRAEPELEQQRLGDRAGAGPGAQAAERAEERPRPGAGGQALAHARFDAERVQLE